jgi:hypothetical protein
MNVPQSETAPSATCHGRQHEPEAASLIDTNMVPTGGAKPRLTQSVKMCPEFRF